MNITFLYSLKKLYVLMHKAPFF